MIKNMHSSAGSLLKLVHVTRWRIFVSLGSLLLVLGTPLQAQAAPAFPGCQGFGCESDGGRGGVVCAVTNTNSSGAGSFESCMLMTEPRIVIFKVSGIISTNTGLQLRSANSDVTVLGQTAPGDGVMLKPAADWMTMRFGDNSNPANGFHDGVFQHIRWRSSPGTSGTGSNRGQDAFAIYGGCHDIVFDHNEILWTSDEAFNMYNLDSGGEIKDITISRSIIGEGGLAQNYGPLNTGSPIHSISYHHNLFIHTNGRTPKHSLSDGTQNVNRGIEYINNVFYNTAWNIFLQTTGGQSGDPNAPYFYPKDQSQVADIIGNYTKQGPQWGAAPVNLLRFNDTVPPNGVFSLYWQGHTWRNIDGTPHANNNEANNYTMYGGYETWVGTATPTVRNTRIDLPTHPIAIGTYNDAYNSVVVNEDVGAMPHDAHAKRLVDAAENGGAYDQNLLPPPFGSGSVSFQTFNVPTDSDNDGLPDSYETQIGTNPAVFENHAVLDNDGDGYVNIENWAYSLVEPGTASIPAPPPPKTPKAPDPFG